MPIENSGLSGKQAELSIEASVWNAVKKWLKSPSGVAFLSALLIGLAVHLYVYTNLYLGHDASIFYHYSGSWDTQTGRFAGTYVKQLTHGSLQLPLLIGFIVLLLLGLSSALICKTLRIEKPVYVVLTSACIVTWPTVVSINCFIYMSSQFGIAVFAACLAVYVAERYRWGFAYAVPLIIVSMACYQAYWGTAAMLMLLCIIRDIFETREPASKIWFIKALRYAAALALGLLAYYGLWQFLVSVSGLELPSHVGMNSAGFASLAEFFSILKDTYYYVYAFYFKTNLYSYYPAWLRTAVLLGVAVALFLAARLAALRKIHKQPGKCLLLALAVLLLPVAVNCARLFAKGLTDSPLTKFAFISPLLILLMLLSLTADEKGVFPSFRLKTAAFGLSLAVLLASFLNGLFGANATYVKLEATYHMALSHMTQYLSRIQAEPEYRANMTPVFFVGDHPPARPLTGFEWTRDIHGAPDSAMPYTWAVQKFFATFMASDNPVDITYAYKDRGTGARSLPLP